MGAGKIPKDLTWGAAKKLMGNVEQFLNMLINFDKVPTPYTLHPTPYTLHPTTYTLHPTSYTLHPTPYT